MGDSKSDYWKGYGNGQSDSGKSKSVIDIAIEATIPGAGPKDGKSDAFKAGYDAGKKDGSNKK